MRERGEGEGESEGPGEGEGLGEGEGEGLGEGEGEGEGESAGEGEGLGEGESAGEGEGLGEGESGREAAARVVAPRRAIAVGLGVTAAAIGAARVGLDPGRAGQPIVVGAFAIVYGAIAIAAVAWLRRRGDGRLLRPASGDIAIGAISAGVLYAGAMAARMALATAGTPREAWIVRLYLQLGVADALKALGRPEASGPLFGVAIACVAAAEELAWRGLVQRSLESAMGTARAAAVTTGLYVLANLPSALLLRDPTAGANPLLVLGALTGSVVWTALYLRRGTLLPAVFSHALFSWAMVEFPLWR